MARFGLMFKRHGWAAFVGGHGSAVRQSRIGAACPGNAQARNDSRFTRTSLGMSEVTILEGRTTLFDSCISVRHVRVRVFFLAENATGNLFEWKYGIFGDDRAQVRN